MNTIAEGVTIAMLEDRINLADKRIVSLEQRVQVNTDAYHRIVDYLAVRELRLSETMQKLAETMDTLAAHLTEHLKHCTGGVPKEQA